MLSDDDFLQNFAIKENIFSSTSSDDNDKTTAWRQQAIILQHITRNSSDSTKLAALRQHMQKLQPNDHDAFIQRRAIAVDALLKDFQPRTSPHSHDLSDLDTFIEQPCRGVFESCRHDEISSSQLQQLFPKTIGKDVVSNISTNKYSNSSAGPPQTIPAPIATTSRNTLSSYLQRKPQMEASTMLNSNRETTPQQQEPAAASADNAFRTAREELIIQNSKKHGGSNVNATPLFNYGTSKKSLGARRNVRSGFVPPIRTDDSTTNPIRLTPPSGSNTPTNTPPDVEPIDERLINIDPKMIELIRNEIMHKFKPIDWDDIAGLDYAKSIIKEAVVYPLLRPDIFTGLRRPPRGILLFGPPGTGKTLIGKCIASKSQSTFFSISASSLTSKWIGDGEKMVRALFAVATVHQPSVVFIDEIDSLLSQRSETEHESSRRLKTEFLVQLDGAATSDDDRILIVGATNRPQELDEAARRRLVRRLYIPLPEMEARVKILKNLLQTVRNEINETEIREIGNMTVGYSGADMESLCREASMEPIRTIPADEIPFFNEDKVRPVNIQDFRVALQNVRPSVSQDDLKQYVEWNQIYGAGK